MIELEFMLDTTNLENIEKLMGYFPIAGITSTPSIIQREGKIDFYKHMKKTREVIGEQRSLHMQVPSKKYEGMVRDAKMIWENIDKNVYVKFPSTSEGLRAIHYFKSQGNYNITASAIYSQIQGNMAIQAGADYIAVYTDRLERVNEDPFSLIRSFRQIIDREGHKTKIMASSIKNVNQINKAFNAGADAATFHTSIIADCFDTPMITNAVDGFTEDWVELYGREMIG